MKYIIIKLFTLIYSLIGYFQHIRIDGFSSISPKSIAIKSVKLNGSKQFPIYIKNSSIGNLKADEGCKINNVSCNGNIELGRFVSLNGPGTRISARINNIKIGSFTSIASNVIIQEDFHNKDRITSYFIYQNIFNEDIKKDIASKGPIVIEEDVWIGSNSVVLSGVTIGRGSVIGAGSIVTKDIPRYSIVVGNPAKVIKQRFSQEVINILEASKWWEADINHLNQITDVFELDLTIMSNIEKLKNIINKI